MGANPTQALGVLLFIVAMLLLAGGLAAGGSALLLAGALIAFAFACVVFQRCKPWEHGES